MMAESVSSNPVGAKLVLLFSRPLRTLTCANLPPSSTSIQNDEFERTLNPMQMQMQTLILPSGVDNSAQGTNSID